MTTASGPAAGRDVPPPDETVVFRPRLARIASLVIGSVVLGVMVLLAILVPMVFTIVDRLAFVVFGLGVFWFCWRESAVKVVAGPRDVIVRNLFGTRTLEWPQIVAVSFPEGDAWAHLDLADGDTLPTMAFQRADGARGIEAARRMSRMVKARGEAPEISG